MDVSYRAVRRSSRGGALPDAAVETEVLLIEPDGTINTGDAGGAMTAEPRTL